MVRIGHIGLFRPECDEIHVSVSFTWDLPEARLIADEYKQNGYPVKIGGPGTGMRGEDFSPGMYLKPGYTITSRGCPNRCWFCGVWKREGDIRELPIREGWNVIDDNLLACSEKHIMAVFGMLRTQSHPVRFTGGLDAARLTPDIADELLRLKPKQIFLAYDTPDDLMHVERATEMLRHRRLADNPSHTTSVFVLVGYPKDTLEDAEKRLRAMLSIGLVPMAMLYRDETGRRDAAWIHFQKLWARPAAIMGARA